MKLFKMKHIMNSSNVIPDGSWRSCCRCFSSLLSFLAATLCSAQTFEDWLLEHSIPIEKSAPEDRNGALQLQNLYAYALGINPLTASKADLPSISATDPTGIQIAYRMNGSAADLMAEFEVSGNLLEWEALAPLTDVVVSTDGGIENREAVFAWDAIENKMLRIRASLEEEDSLFVEIPPGVLSEFGGYLREITISQAYAIGKYEVTGGEWQKVYDWGIENGYEELASSTAEYCSNDHPVIMVNWYHMIMWCNAKSEMEGFEPVYYDNSSGQSVVYRGPAYSGFYTENGPGSEVIEWDESKNGYRLPVHDEWEYAARGGQSTTNSIYSGSNDIYEVGIFSDNSFGAVCDGWTGGEAEDDRGAWPVGSRAPNELGLYDMSGNVWEILWDPRYSGDPYLLRARTAASACWWFGEPTVSNFTGYQPIQTGTWLGFRLARTLE